MVDAGLERHELLGEPLLLLVQLPGLGDGGLQMLLKVLDHARVGCGARLARIFLRLVVLQHPRMRLRRKKKKMMMMMMMMMMMTKENIKQQGT